MRKIPKFKFKPFSQKQRKVLNWWCEESPVRDCDGIIADGAIRSGKTVSMSLSFVFWAMNRFDGQNLAMCGKTIGSFRRNVLTGLKLMLRCRGYKVTHHRADNLVIINWQGKENYFYIFGGKDERSQDLIQGITLAGVFFDEVALMPESFVNQATARCSVDGSKFWFNCNPDGPFHWFKTGWIDKAAEKRLLVLHFTMDDNLSLSKNIKARYREQYVGVFFKRYILGLWAIAEGIIYDMFDPEKHVVDVMQLEKEGNIVWTGKYYVSCDYGTQNATVFHLWRKSEDGIWYCIKEYYYSGRDERIQKTDGEFSKDLRSWLDGISPLYIIVDPSAASFIAQLKQDGFRVKSANNNVIDGIRFVATLISQSKIMFDKSCENTIQEFSAYRWDEKAANRGEDRPVKERDHCVDSTRYFCMTIIRRPSGVSILK